ncbi:protein CDV3 homolog [Phymastichus coffea]|uniref:protein CDV3 homolog n=1 Tax=Phymastichus coffea TaxID=108790 RepID=UPI00273B8581|nr:protein CDV3 homolog [Phymastichus coffea]
MADLDDFFAKKDRKKGKGKKFTTTEEIAKKLEETGKKVDKPKPKEKPTNAESEDNQPIEEEDEWKEFEEEKKDYTGLKIGNLTVSAMDDNDVDDDRGTGDNSSDGESGEPGGKHLGPWKMSQSQSQGQPEPESTQPTPQPQPVQQPPPSSTGGTYKIPHLRHGAPPPERVGPGPRMRSKNIAPDINSEEYFPTLNAKPPTNDAVGAWGRKKRDEGSFEEVRNRGAGRQVYSAQENQPQAPKLSLGNKYGALSQDQS